MMFNDRVPEEVRRRLFGFISGNLIRLGAALRFGNLRVGVNSRQVVDLRFPAGNHGFVFKSHSEIEILFLAGYGIQFQNRGLNASEFRTQHPFKLFRGQRVEKANHPVHVLFRDVQSQLAAAVSIGVQKPGQNFVLRIERNDPRLSHERYVPGGGLFKEVFPVGNGGDVTFPARVGSESILNLRQPFDGLVDAGFELFVARGSVHFRRRRQKMPEGMPRQRGRLFPAAVNLSSRLGRQSRFRPESNQKPVRLQRTQIRSFEILNVCKHAGRQPNVFQRRRHG